MGYPHLEETSISPIIPTIILGKLKYFTNLSSKAILGWFPLLTMIPGFGRTGFGCYNVPRWIHYFQDSGTKSMDSPIRNGQGAGPVPRRQLLGGMVILDMNETATIPSNSWSPMISCWFRLCSMVEKDWKSPRSSGFTHPSEFTPQWRFWLSASRAASSWNLGLSQNGGSPVVTMGLLL